MLVFSLTMAASIDQIVVINRGDTHGNTRFLSFSVLAVFLHMLFELRITRSVCKYVTIIQEAVYEMRVFFFIFAGGILAFAIATLHLLRSCPYEGCDPSTSAFSGNFIEALFETYFFMVGSIRLYPSCCFDALISSIRYCYKSLLIVTNTD
ncbi:hypothetical protein EDD21DRAFT_226230 [Dissophora ornata]|nr:hypothetical protein EDD21DRAFT_226230 [Dissophora ornata]